MKDEALESVFSAIFMNFEDESEFSASVKTRFSEVFHVKDKLPQLIEKCKNLATFQLEVFVGNHPIHVYIIKPETCWEQTLKPGIINKIDLGKSLEVSLKFSLKPAENAEKIKRSASLLKKVGFFDEKKKKSSESFLQVASLPIGSKCKKNIHLGGGKTTVFDLKLVVGGFFWREFLIRNNYKDSRLD
ncbi:unnamed protein product [Caenorhabditis angaria]|uniref:Uncharacterized protein n=1 Tax=Caenorhabditis angaria TaxID=860376 RepID=A0A9P1I725_9PELO|nr:unnamed protein product [Caenorhabditis angaria]